MIIIIIIIIIVIIIITIFVPFFFLGLKFVQEDVIVLIEGSHINTSDTCALSAVTGIPVISLSRDTRPINECKKSVQMHPGYQTYAHATLDVVNTFQWKKIALLYDGKNLSYGFYFMKELCSCQVNEIALFFGLFVLFVLFLFFALNLPLIVNHFRHKEGIFTLTLCYKWGNINLIRSLYDFYFSIIYLIIIIFSFQRIS